MPLRSTRFWEKEHTKADLEASMLDEVLARLPTFDNERRDCKHENG
jgi:hypothetical protein